VSGGPPNLDAQRCNAGAASNDRPTVHSLNDPADRDLLRRDDESSTLGLSLDSPTACGPQSARRGSL